MITVKELQELDMARQDDPRSVNRKLAEALSVVPGELVHEILLVYGATFRQLGQLSDARWSYFEGERFSKRFGTLSDRAQFLQRRSWVEFLDGKMDLALNLLRESCGIFCELGLFNMEGETLTDIAMQYYDRGMVEESAQAAIQALDLLEESNFRFRFCAYQALAMSNKEMGQMETAIKYSNLVKETAPLCPHSWQVRAIWMDAEVKRETIDELEMATLLRTAAEFFLDRGEVLDGSIAMLQQALIHLKHNNLSKVDEIAKEFKRIAFLAQDGLAAGVCIELYRVSLESRLKQSQVAVALRKLEKGRAGARPDEPSHWG